MDLIGERVRLRTLRPDDAAPIAGLLADPAKVCLAVYQGNDRARRCYEKAGFGVEGVRRRQLWRDGAWHDETLMAVFADHPLYAAPATGG